MRKPPCNHESPVAGCRLCWLFANDSRYRELWNNTHSGNSQPTRQAKEIRLCVFYVDGESVLGDEAPDLVRDWRRCGMGHGVVCPCLLMCGPACPDYQPNS